MFHHQHYINPASFSPVLWIDFTDTSTISIVSGGIDAIAGKGSFGLTFTAPSSGARPTPVPSAVNGLDVASFNGTTQELRYGSSNLFRNVTGATVYIVRKWASVPTTSRTALLAAIPSGSSRVLIGGGNTPNKNYSAGRTLDANGAILVDSAANVTTSAFQIQTTVFDYANTDLYQYIGNTLDGFTGSFQSATTTSNTASLRAAIGSASGLFFFNGSIAEVLVFHTAHNAATRNAIWNYIGVKYAI